MMSHKHRRILIALMQTPVFFILLAVTPVVHAGSITSGRISSMHWAGDQLRISAVNSEGQSGACSIVDPPYYGERFLLPGDEKLIAAAMMAKTLQNIINIYWDDAACQVVGLDIYK